MRGRLVSGPGNGLAYGLLPTGDGPTTGLADDGTAALPAGLCAAGEAAPVAGIVLTGTVTGGEGLAGTVTAGEGLAGTLTAGEGLAGTLTAGEGVAGTVITGEGVAGRVTGGEGLPGGRLTGL